MAKSPASAITVSAKTLPRSGSAATPTARAARGAPSRARPSYFFLGELDQRAEEARRPDEEDHEQDPVGHRVAVHRRHERGAQRLQDAEDQPADDGAPDVAEPADDGGGEALQRERQPDPDVELGRGKHHPD